jgi:putative membrane protein
LFGVTKGHEACSKRKAIIFSGRLAKAPPHVKMRQRWIQERTMLASILIAVVALLHLYFMYLEMVAWDTPSGRRTFNLTPEFARASKTLAANQGLYNGFLAAGLLWGLLLGDTGFEVKTFFLVCVIVAGVFGAATVSRKILYVQAAPAALALICLVTGV